MKILFITHDIGIYGASRSLQLLTKQLNQENELDLSLVVNKRLIRKNDLRKIELQFGINLAKINQFHLPSDTCEVGRAKRNLYHYLKQLLWYLNAFSFYRFVKKNKYDIIYLNSITLHELINKKLPFVIHIREIYDGSNNKVFNSLNNSKGIIYIDNSTRNPFISKIINSNEIIINNPFHQSDLFSYENLFLDLQEKYKDKFVFCVIGLLKPTKGQHFIIQSFIKAQIPNSVLLVVGGSTDKKYSIECNNLAKNQENITIWGEEPDINKIYLISNCIIRAESYFCIGRTTFEGLYSGCKVILPGFETTNSEDFFDFHKFKDKVNFYEPRNENDFIEQLRNVAFSPILQKKYSSNLEQYSLVIKSFFKRILF